jgi:DNA modification methylase
MIKREVFHDAPITTVRPNPDNPRVNEKAIKEVIKSIQASEYISPIIVDETDMILAGNSRYAALRQLGYDTVPMVVKITGLTEEQKKRFILADNKTQEFAEWDWGRLGVFDESMLEDVGFSDAEIDKIMRPGQKDTYSVPVDVRDNADIKQGDLFQIGPHRIVCGDSTDIASYNKVMGGKKAEMIFCDPPYNIDYEGGMSSDGGKHKRDKIANDSMSEEDFFTFLKSFIECSMEVCDGIFYICMSSKEMGQLKKAFVGAGGHWQAFIIWVKHTFTLSRSDWQNRYEPIMYGWNGNNKNHYYAGWRDEGNVWENLDVLRPYFDGKKTYIRIGEYHIELEGEVKGRLANKRGEIDIWPEKKLSKTPWHPNEKPMPLVMKAIQASSHRGGLVLDPFLGGGSTILACHETGRIGHGIEIEPRFVDVVLRRMNMADPDLPILHNGQAYDKGKLR